MWTNNFKAWFSNFCAFSFKFDSFLQLHLFPTSSKSYFGFCFFISLNVWNFFFIILSVRFSILYMQWRQSNFPVSQKSTKTVKLTRGYCEHCPVIKRFIETHSSKLLYMFNSKSTVTRLQRMTKRPKPDRRRRAKSNDIKQTESHLLNTSEYISLICCAIIFTLLKHK